MCRLVCLLLACALLTSAKRSAAGLAESRPQRTPTPFSSAALGTAPLFREFAKTASTADEVIRRVESRYNGVRTLSVDFVENYSMQGHPRPPEEGKLTLRKQGKMRWDYTRPSGKLFVSDGKTVYLYSAVDNRVEKIPLKDTEDMRAPLAFLLGRLDMKKEFRDFAVHPAEGGVWLDAGAKNDRVPYDKIQMLVSSDGEVRQLKVSGRDQSLLDFSFRAERLNPPVADNFFHFIVPAGAEVVDSVAFDGQER